MQVYSVNFREWWDTDAAIDLDVELLRESIMSRVVGGVRDAVGYTGDKVRCFWQWMKNLARTAAGAYRFMKSLLQKAPAFFDIVLGVPSAAHVLNKDPVCKDTMYNKSFLQAVRMMSDKPDFAKEELVAKCQELKKLAQEAGDDAAFAEEFLRSNVYAFLKTLWNLSHLGPILSRIPKVTAHNTWVALQKFWDAEQKRIAIGTGAIAAGMAAVELVMFIFSAGVMTGLMAKLMLLMHQYQMAAYFGVGAWGAWLLVNLLHRVTGDHSKEPPPECATYARSKFDASEGEDSDPDKGFCAKVIAWVADSITPIIEPGHHMDLPARVGQKKPAQSVSTQPQPLDTTQPPPTG